MSEPVAVPIIPSNEPVPKRVRVDSPSSSVVESHSLESYSSTYNKPYPMDYFGLSDTDGSSSNVESITKHLSEMTDGSIEMVKGVLDEIGSKLNLQENDSGIFKLNKILAFLGIKSIQNKESEMSEQALRDIQKDVEIAKEELSIAEKAAKIELEAEKRKIKAESNRNEQLKKQIAKGQDKLKRMRAKVLADIKGIV
jgi:hypothetical protein